MYVSHRIPAVSSDSAWPLRCFLFLVLLTILVGPGVALASVQTAGALLLPAGTIALTSPDPGNMSVQPCDALDGMFLVPDQPTAIPASIAEITVRNNVNAPIENAAVTVEVGASNPICPGAVLVGTTNSSGRCDIVLAGGGCVDQVALAGVIRANGVVIRAYSNVKSPDADGNLRVDLADLVSFSAEFLGANQEDCHDYDNDEETGLSDLVLFSQAFVPGNHCP